MKKLNQYIHEKYLIDADTKPDSCQTFVDLLDMYRDLKEMEVHPKDQASGFTKILKCSDKIFNTYTEFFKRFRSATAPIDGDMRNCVSDKCFIEITTVDDFDQSQWYDIIVTTTKYESMMEIIFNVDHPLIKIYMCKQKDYTDDAARIIDFVLSK